MAAAVTFFLPAIHERPTGGNIYNRRLIERLRKHSPVHVRVRGRDELRLPTGVSDDGVHIGIVDSLPLHEIEAFYDWARGLRVDRLILLGHYLHVVDPDRDMGSEAQREREYLPAFDAFVVTSDYVRRRLIREGCSVDEVLVLRPGVEPRFRTEPARLKMDPPTVLTVASQLPVKGLVEGIEVFETLGDRDWHWEIVGEDRLDAAYAHELRQRVASSAVGDRIELIGPVDPEEIISRYDAADVFFLPSRFETCSMVTMEAMCRGRPVVAYDVGGLSELIDDGVTGYLAERGSVHTAAGYLQALLEDPDRRIRMGREARKTSRQFATWPEAANRFREFVSIDGEEGSN